MTPTQLEERLTAALTARADQVTAADLRPPAPPTGRRLPPSRGLYLGMALAAALSAVAVLVLLTQVRESPVRPSKAPSEQLTRLPVTDSDGPSATPRPGLPTWSGPASATPGTSPSDEPSPSDTPGSDVTVRPILPTTRGPVAPTSTRPAPQAVPTTAPDPAETNVP